MPRISDYILDSVIYLYASEADAKAGTNAGGTGFLVGVKSLIPLYGDNHGVHIYAVTNSHVVREGRSHIIRVNTIDDSFDVISLEPGMWIHHAIDDLAICSLELDPNLHKVGYWPAEQFLTKELLNEYQVGPGHTVFSVGRFINHEGKQRNIPVVRWGSIAMLPWEPILHPRGYLQESFLIEARSVSGYSGSPVFLDDEALSWEAYGRVKAANPKGGMFQEIPHVPMLLLGVNWGNMEVEGKEKLIDRKLGIRMPYNVLANSGMSQVVPAWKLQELLDLEELVKQRAKVEEDIERNYKDEHGGAVLDVEVDDQDKLLAE